MRYIIEWAVGHLAWMALVYSVSFAYDRFKKRPTNTLLSALGTLLATASAVIAVQWWTPFFVDRPAGTLWYYVGVGWVAALGTFVCGTFLYVLLWVFDEYEAFDTGWLYQMALPFYVSISLFCYLTVVVALLAFVVP